MSEPVKLRPQGYPTAAMRWLHKPTGETVLQQEWVVHGGRVDSSISEWRDVGHHAEPTGWPDEMCPNCVTPWKCNGPHIPQ